MSGILASALPAISPLVSRNISVAGRRTSMRLEPVFWHALAQVAKQERLTAHQVVTMVDQRRRDGEASLTSAVRSFLLGYAIEQSRSAGPRPADGAGGVARKRGAPASTPPVAFLKR